MVITKTGVYTYNEEEFPFNFVTGLPASMKVSFVESVTNALIDEKNNNYNSVIRDIIFDFYVIVAMTDVDVTDIADSGDIDAIEEFVNETGIVSIVKANSEDGFIQSLSDAVDANLQYRTGVKIDAVSKSISSLLNTIERKIPEFDMDELMSTSGLLSQIADDFSQDNMLDAFAKSDEFRKYLFNNKEVLAPSISDASE